MGKKLIFILCFISTTAFGQKGERPPRFFGNLMVADSAAGSFLIPVQYNSDLLSSNKIALWNDYYANIIFYDFKTDASKRLFKNDTFIKSFPGNNNYNRYENRPAKQKNISQKWVFYFVMEVDYNKNGRIDANDPAVLYVSDKNGDNLKVLTKPNENAVSIDIFDQQGFALVKLQKDADNDKDFDAKDKDYYYVRLDLNTLSFGKKIEVTTANQP